MRKLFIMCLLVVTSFSGCSSWQGNPVAVQAGASIGGVVGSIIGDRAGGYAGSQFGALLGTVAGATVGNAITTPKNNEDPYVDDGYYIPNSNGNYNSNNGNYNNNYNGSLKPQYAQSPIVISKIRFIDDNKNHVINAEENGKIIFEITNESPVAIYNVTPVIAISGVKNLYVSPSQVISYMEPGNTIRYTASLLAGKRLKTGTANFNIYATDSNGAVSAYHEFSLPTQKRIK